MTGAHRTESREPASSLEPGKADRPAAAQIARALGEARRVFDVEIAGLRAVQARLDAGFERAVEALAACNGRVIVTGLGKSGIVAKKIAATLTSTGTRSLYLHPVEAAHGDMGILAPEDVLLVVSYSGANDELQEILIASRRLRLPIVALTGDAHSTLALQSDVVVDCRVPEEACPHGLAPTSSTTAALVTGDALAVALLQRRGFRAEEFALTHPSGVLGRRLQLTVGESMRRARDLPLVSETTSLRDALLVMIEKRLGCVFVHDAEECLAGIVTDGDLKRILVRDPQVMERAVGGLMVRNPKCIGAEALVVDALRRMEENPGGAITQLAVVDAYGRLTGAIHMHDIVRLGLASAPPV
jgi:arabinose-5-phosphate isomerase